MLGTEGFDWTTALKKGRRFTDPLSPVVLPSVHDAMSSAMFIRLAGAVLPHVAPSLE